MSLFNKLTLELYNIVYSIFLILLKYLNHWVSMSESKENFLINENKTVFYLIIESIIEKISCLLNL